VTHLEKIENTKDPGLDSVRFVSITWTADQVSTYARQKLDDNDKLVVKRIRTGEHQGWLAKAVWDWITARL
jgi:hypothetical protein